jgi:hypothetical protein
MEIVPIVKWGKDHWSAFAYIEVLQVENGGLTKGIAIPDRRRMRCNPHTHPGVVNISPAGTLMDGSKYPTRLFEGEIAGHDDWDCLSDAVAAGLLEDVGTGVNPAYRLTKLGRDAANKLREHKAAGGRFATFKFTESSS